MGGEIRPFFFMSELNWRINYANGLLEKLEAVRKNCGGGQIHAVGQWVALLNTNIMLCEKGLTDARLAIFDEAIQEVERFLETIVVPQAHTETRRGFMSTLWRTHE